MYSKECIESTMAEVKKAMLESMEENNISKIDQITMKATIDIYEKSFRWLLMGGKK